MFLTWNEQRESFYERQKRNRMDDFWKKYWVDHAHSTESESLQLQIQRQVNKEPVSDLVFQQVLEDIERKTALNNDDVILDLCCGNGVIR